MIHNGKKPFEPQAGAVGMLASLCLWGLLSVGPAACQPAPRYFAHLQSPPPQVCIAVFNPVVGTLQELDALRREGLMPTSDILVVGVYHEKETGDYKAARRYVEEQGLEWVQFHALAGELSPENIYGENECSNDFALIVRLTDGAILFGGPDIPPVCYGEETHLSTLIQDRYRHYTELSFVFHLLGGSQNKAHRPLLADAPDYVLLGICLGAQTINVATGGTLVQDIWQETYHTRTYEEVLRLGKERWHTNPFRRLYPEAGLLGYQLHPIKLSEGGLFCQVWGFSALQTPLVVSSHHQAVGKRGKGIAVAATSADGRVVEAITHTTFKNVLGVQFHPDFPILWDANQQFRFVPGDTESSLRAILEANPPSMPFNRQVWTWFFSKAAERRHVRLSAVGKP